MSTLGIASQGLAPGGFSECASDQRQAEENRRCHVCVSEEGRLLSNPSLDLVPQWI